jgi:replication factor C subunit 3/5
MARPSKKAVEMTDALVQPVKKRVTKSKIVANDIANVVPGAGAWPVSVEESFIQSLPTFTVAPRRNVKVKVTSTPTFLYKEGVTFEYPANTNIIKLDEIVKPTTTQPTVSFFSKVSGNAPVSDVEKDVGGTRDNVPKPQPQPQPLDDECVNTICHTTPWVEKYRPSNFEDIVLDPLNKVILNNILEMNYFPNLLLYGPPGTGKTTTIINLVNAYQEKFKLKNKGLMIHLNASDDRGIDIIRNQINSFVSSKSLFGDGIKFVILDEVDYMTKNAQTALRYLLNSYNNNNVRFCLICNYVSRIDESLQSEFVRMRFNQLPEADIISFLRRINDSERLMLTDDTLVSIQRQFNSDIRSMINYMQTNQDIIQNCNIVKDDIWIRLLDMVKSHVTTKSEIISYINTISRTYNIERKNIIKNYLNFIIRKRPECIVPSFLSNIENIMHLQDGNTEYIINYIVLQMMKLFRLNKETHSYGEM